MIFLQLAFRTIVKVYQLPFEIVLKLLSFHSRINLDSKHKIMRKKNENQSISSLTLILQQTKTNKIPIKVSDLFHITLTQPL